MFVNNEELGELSKSIEQTAEPLVQMTNVSANEKKDLNVLSWRRSIQKDKSRLREWTPKLLNFGLFNDEWVFCAFFMEKAEYLVIESDDRIADSSIRWACSAGQNSDKAVMIACVRLK